MARLIDADSGQESVEYLKRHLIVGDSEFLSGYLRGAEALADGLAKLPPVDAVPVVRCRDCKFGVTPYGDEHDGWIECSNIYGRPLFGCNDFCSYGERKEGEGNG